MSGVHWHSTNYLAVTSYLTSRTILINQEQESFFISPESFWRSDRLKEELAELHASAAWKGRAISRHFLDIVEPVLALPSRESIGAAIDAIMAEHPHWSTSVPREKAERREFHHSLKPWAVGDRTRISEWIKILWSLGVIATPRNPTYFFRTKWNLRNSIKTALHNMLINEGVREKYTLALLASIDDVMLCLLGCQSIGDLVPDVVNFATDEMNRRSLTNRLRIAITESQKAEHGDLKHIEGDIWPRRILRFQADPNFRWAIEADAKMKDWAALAAEYISQVRAGIAQKMHSMRYFFKAVIESSTMPRSPAEFLQKSSNIDLDIEKIGPEYINYLVDFLDWVLERQFSEVRTDGIRVLLPGYRNPVQKRRKGPRPAESVRDAMPPHLLQMLIDVLTEDDWTWARRATGLPGQGGSNGADWFRYRDTETGEWREEWQPVRAVVLYAKLMFPARTIQIRLLDSGESDDTLPDLEKMEMVRNPSQVGGRAFSSKTSRSLARRPNQRGAVQIVQGRKSGYLTLHFTTNKTADIDKSSWERGYTSPWMPKELAEEFVKLRAWQEKMNPVDAPTPWTKLAEFREGNYAKHESRLVGMESTFLFRDRTHYDSRRWDEPISASKIDQLYFNLCLEVERRCAEAGIIGPDGNPIKLISSRDKRGNPSGFVYPLHALRVSIVTHFIEDGEVSPEIMMKIVGHATVIMTLYYIKHNQDFIAEAMLRGDSMRQDKARRAWIADARNKELEDLRKFAIAKGDGSLNIFRDAPSGSLIPLNIGVCPVACRRCNVGGQKLNTSSFHENFGAVPGGQANCAGCRFLISGEPWLEGVAAEFNVRSLDVSLKNRHLDQLNQRLLPLDDERQEAMQSGRLFEGFQEWQSLKNQTSEIEGSLNQLHIEMANLLILNEQISAIAKRRMSENSQGVALVVGDIVAVETALQESTEFDLVDRICNSAVAFPSLAARGTVTATATLFRARAWDLVLKRHGLEPRFLDLDSDLAGYVGNRLSEWLDMRVGRPNTLRLMAGGTLAEICRETGLIHESVLHDLQFELESAIAQPLSIGLSHARIAAR
jgi:hypothetical protein